MQNNSCVFFVRSLAACGALLLLGVAGCSEYRSVEGTLTLDGEPVPKAVIELLPVEEGMPSPYGETDEKGRFTIKTSRDQLGALPGVYKVSIQHVSQSGSGAAMRQAVAPGEEIPREERAYTIPKRYYGRGSELELDVTGNVKKDFALTSEE